MSSELCKLINDTGVIKDDNSLKEWLNSHVSSCIQPNKTCYLLAHAEDGVIWGKFDHNQLITADEVFDKQTDQVDLPKLRLLTLQQCRIFGDQGEILLWYNSQGWKARLCQDNSDTEKIEEDQILWGTKGQEKDGFTLLSDGSQGLQHAVPLTGVNFGNDPKDLYRPVRLKVHHYINYDDSGVARIYLSRLVSLCKQEKKL